MAKNVVAGVLKNSILLGQVVPSNLQHAVKVQVPYFFFDEGLKAYFKKTQEFIAVDHSNECKVGDVVLVEKLAKQIKTEITHSVSQTVYNFGDIQDPISGEMVEGTEYRTRKEQIDALFGATNNFDYKNAPKRGWQEGKRDFTDKPVYREWHVFDDVDPYSIRN
uniref:Mitochondrial 28S ribosomal protein S17 n=1 Tax=Acartia pacifica TaxID=335913 RepID=A0A0U2KCZ6_ACAPC|nr:mitochondrial 28S ribosomal protein S17 [Acartia pacifica]